MQALPFKVTKKSVNSSYRRKYLHLQTVKRLLLIPALFSALCMAVIPAYAQETAPEKLKASHIHAKGRSLRALRPYLGIPRLSYNIGTYDRNQRNTEPEILLTNAICGTIYGERIEQENGVWISRNLDFGMPNWIAWEIPAASKAGAYGTDITTSGRERDMLRRYMPEGKVKVDSLLWSTVLDECWKWALEKPLGNLSVACGPLVYGPERSKGKDAMPYEYFLVICKKCHNRLGYKSVGFLIPNRPITEGGRYKFSECVNLIEHKSGYDFFPELPENLQELVEGMTTYELFCSFVEQEGYREDPEEREDDFNDVMMDYFEDFHDR